MTTPIADFIDKYIDSDSARFHMPGHKGVGETEKYDITEIGGADVLYSANGIINESENNASSLFATAHSYYSTEGSTLAIKAMLALATQDRFSSQGRPLILAARNAHKAFIAACALLDLDVEWMFPKEFTHLCECLLSADEVAFAIKNAKVPPCAVYLTSPDYLGNIADIKGIAAVCKNAHIPLLVDNAHGAYLKFLTPSRHPIDLGAAMCCDSAHKTLPTLTGAAYLHVSKEYSHFCDNARRFLSLFASTSPSYLILRSLDLCNKYLSDEFSSELSRCIERTEHIKKKLSDMGISTKASEPLKIVIEANKIGYSGNELCNILRERAIEAEFSDGEFAVMMTSPKNTAEDFEKLSSAFEELTIKEAIIQKMHKVIPPVKAMSIRDAMLSPCERINPKNALNRICASFAVSCPPAVPITVCGELIGENQLELFDSYGIEYVDIIKIEKND